MNKKLLSKILPLTLSTGFFWSGLPAVNTVSVQFTNVNVVEAAKTAAKNWNFSHDLGSWNYSGKWGYTGTPSLEYDKAVGGAGKLDVDFSGDADKSWSEVKIRPSEINDSTPLVLTGYNVLTYNFYFDAAAMQEGAFKTKLYMKSNTGKEIVNTYTDVDMAAAKPVAGTSLKKVAVRLPFTTADADITYMELSVVGCNTNYRGALYVNNITLGHENVKDGYVQKTARVIKKDKVELSDLALPAQINLADGKASESAAQLAAYLKSITGSGKVLYGHQNDMHKKAGIGPSDSDTYDMVGDYPAVVGIDGLALTGSEMSLTDEEKASGMTFIDKAVQVAIKAKQKGAIITLSNHMPNFADVAKRGKVNGQYDYSGYSPNVTTGDVVSRIMPGGDLNGVYRGYLDMVAQYDKRLQDLDIPVLYRPFHECNGSWFWWGAAFCSPSQFKNLYRYTEEYLRDTKGLHNILYVYSPGGPVTSEADYLTRYPGDAFVDIVGFDMYHRDPAKADDWMTSLDATMNVMSAFAKDHDKIPAASEVGILVGNSAMLKSGNQRLDWFNEILRNMSQHGMAYFMTWSNFDETNFDEPYMVSPSRGHEMVNQFIDFYNKPQVIFAGQMPDYRKIKVIEQAAVKTYGYIVSPNSYNRILTPQTLKATVSGKSDDVQFVYKKNGVSVAATKAVQDVVGSYSAQITQADLTKIGKSMGTIDLVIDGKSADSVKVIFNIPQPPKDISLVDDFEGYYGDNGLLQAVYSTNNGAGCSVSAALSDKHSGGDTGLAFTYKINKNGYAGIIKNMNGADWSAYNAVQFWLTPDGKKQKLIIQINTNGEDFEVDLSSYTAGTTPTLVTIPFSQFKGKQNGKFDKSNIQHFAIYCNTMGDTIVDSTMYFDDIKAVK
ncbi:glycosyl hydrolase [Pectinatus frisingensis]|uniref:glycosyl hydrolase n=1 Tax=Pectinatus frisingensis TaxID=865 RepID=UPI0018C7C2C4|nr:glycosyl hydrolase [Pectinatus frisingensis]